VTERRSNNGEFQFFRSLSSVVLFRLLLINNPDGTAARVWAQHENETLPGTVIDSNIAIKQAKRDESANVSGVETQPRGSLAHLSYEEIRARIEAGYGTEHVVAANESAVSWSVLNGRVAPLIESMDNAFRWDQDDDANDGEHEMVAAPNLEPERIVRRDPRPAVCDVSDASIKGVVCQPTTTAPTAPFPTPPPKALPRRQDQVVLDLLDKPTIDFCAPFDPLCLLYPWLFSENSTDFGDDPNEYYGEDKTSCPLPSSSSTSSSKPEPSPFKQGDPQQNEVQCYGSGENTENERMQNAAKNFCLSIENDDLIENYFRSEEYTYPQNGGLGWVSIIVSLDIEPNCEFGWNLNECEKYLSVPTDSCNCGGVNWKQGGVVSNNCYSWRIDPELNIS
jgi:hypothetical protein